MTELSPSAVALGRIEVERARLLGARHALDQLDRIPEFARETRAAMHTSLSNTEGELDRLSGRIRVLGSSESRLARLTLLSKGIDRLGQECFALAVGVLAREHELDRGACEDADELIAELASLVDERLDRPTVPGDSEFLHRAADVIRRRTPDFGLWDLPVMAHEFGHLVVAHLKLYDPINEQILEPGDTALGGWPSYSARQAEEFFCDLLATYALGPAYVCAMILHRLDPTAPAGSGGDHPPDPARAAAVLHMLTKLAAKETASNRYRTTSTRLADTWRTLRQQATDNAEAPEPESVELRRGVGTVLTFLEERLSGLRYTWPSDRILELTTALEQNTRPDPGLELRIRDVLNAAWMLRLNSMVTGALLPPHLEPHARELIAEVAKEAKHR